MDVYIFKADVLCEECGEDARRVLTAEGKAPSNPNDENSYDSDEFPKGPFEPIEADEPKHCGVCGKFLENPVV